MNKVDFEYKWVPLGTTLKDYEVASLSSGLDKDFVIESRGEKHQVEVEFDGE